jgi:DDE superfamily endonuclease
MSKSMLDIYTDYLICSFGQASATGLARLLSNEISHDAVTRFLSAEPKTSAALWHVVKPLVRQVECDDGVIIIDDSIEEKPSTDENELVSWHYDHSKDRTVKGINFLTALYHASDVSLPVAFDLVTKEVEYFDPKARKQRRKSALTKNDRYRMLLRVAVHNQVRFKYVLNDVWFASSENMKFVKHQLKKEFVMPLKENRKVALSGDAKKRGQYAAVSTLELEAETTRHIRLEEVDFPLSLTKEVFTNEDGSRGVRYLVSSDVTLSFDRLMKLYQKRWSIEVYHKSLKQNASLEKSPTRTTTTQRNHLFASLCAYVKLEALKLRSGVGHFTIKSKIYLSALKAAYAEVVKLNPQPLAA